MLEMTGSYGGELVAALPPPHYHDVCRHSEQSEESQRILLNADDADNTDFRGFLEFYLRKSALSASSVFN